MKVGNEYVIRGFVREKGNKLQIDHPKLYSKEEFKKNGIDLYFIKMDNIEYKQFSNEFIPNLSIIDVLMHNGKEGTKELLNKYTLV